MHAPFLGMHQEPKKQNRPSIRAAVRGDSLSELCVPRIERLPAQGTVASPGPVAGSDVTIGPLLMLVHLLSVAIGRCQRYSGTVIAQVSQGFTTLVFGVERWWRACPVTTLGAQPPATGALEGIYDSDKPGRVHLFQDR